MVNYNISLNEELAQIVEREVKVGKYVNRSEFFRDMLRKMFVVGKNIDEVSKLDIEPIPIKSKEHKRLMKLRENAVWVDEETANEQLNKALDS